jgi:hypothetical protein
LRLNARVKQGLHKDDVACLHQRQAVGPPGDGEQQDREGVVAAESRQRCGACSRPTAADNSRAATMSCELVLDGFKCRHDILIWPANQNIPSDSEINFNREPREIHEQIQNKISLSRISRFNECNAARHLL